MPSVLEIWVKPEVAPPMGGAASPEILLGGFIRVHSFHSWFKNIRAGWAEGAS